MNNKNLILFSHYIHTGGVSFSRFCLVQLLQQEQISLKMLAF